MPFLSDKTYYLILPFILYVFWIEQRNVILRKWVFLNSPTFALIVAFFAFLLADWLTNELKELFSRTRPCISLTDVKLLVGCTASLSMPSSHSANAFAILLTIFYFSKKIISPWALLYLLSIALLISFSRVYVGVHYPGDVLAGALWGSLISIFVIVIVKHTILNKKIAPEKGFLIFLILAMSIFRIYYILNGPLDLSPDEAHYWEWSRRLDLSYYSKGPMISYLIHVGTSLFGDNVFGIRIMAVLFSALSSLFLYKLIWKMFNDIRLAVLGASIFQIIPLYAPFGIIFTIDSPFIFFWILSLYLFWLAINETKKPFENSTFKNLINKYRFWFFLGLAIGCGLLTKYTMFFFFLCSLLFLLFTEKRNLLLTPSPYLSIFIALVVFSPVLLWNSQNDWVTLKHTAGHLGLSEGLKISFRSFLEFLASQIGVITPIVFFIMFYSLFKIDKADIKKSFLLYFCVPIFFFFLIKSFQSKVQANWAMHAYITGTIAFVIFYLDSERKTLLFKKVSMLHMLCLLGIMIALGVTIISHYPSLLNLPVKLDPSSRLKGWKKLGEEVSVILRSLSDKGEVVIISDSYQVSSQLAFYVENQPKTFCINLGRRMNQYDLWVDLNSYIENIKENKGGVKINAIFVRMGISDMPQEMMNSFDHFESRVLTVYDKSGNLLRHFTIFICYNFKGFKTPKIMKF